MAKSAKYDDEQRAAIVAAVERGMMPAEAVEAAKQGLGDLEPFDMPEATARHIIANEKRNGVRGELRELEQRQPGSVERLRDRAAAFLHRELDEIESDETGEARERLPTILRSAIQLQKLTRAITPARPTNGGNGDANDETSALLESLAAAMKHERTAA